MALKKSNRTTWKTEVLESCCAIVYRELDALNLEPAREELVRNYEAVKELEAKVREIWVADYGGNPEHWPWNRNFVVQHYIAYRKKTRKTKDGLVELTATPLFPPIKGIVYFIQNERGHIKIGYTDNDPELRLKQLQTGASCELKLLGWIEGSVSTERALHFRFAAFRIRSNGEWFYGTSELLNFIKENS